MSQIIDILDTYIDFSLRDKQTLEQLMMTDSLTLSNMSSTHGSSRGSHDGNFELSGSSGLVLYDATGNPTIQLDPEGNAWFGDDIDNPATTALSVFAISQGYNGEDMGAGDLLFGDNSTGKANMLWDVSEGQLKFRGGTTTQVYIDTDGTLVGGGEQVVLDGDGLRFPNSDSYVDSNMVLWQSAEEDILRVMGYRASGDNLGYIRLEEVTSNDSKLFVEAKAPTGRFAFGQFAAISPTVTTAQVQVQADSNETYPSLVTLSAGNRIDLGGGETPDVIIRKSLTVGNTSAAADNDLHVQNDIRAGGGLYVGSLSTNPSADEAIVDGEVKAGTGILSTGGEIRSEGTTNHTAVDGDGISISWESTYGRLLSYKYGAGATDMPLQLRGSKIDFNEGTTTVLTVDGGDLYTVPWTDYSGTSTINGWSSLTTTEIWYKKVGDRVFCHFTLQGTSGGGSATSVNFTLPYSVDTGMGQSVQVCVYGIDDGTPQTLPARLDIPASGAVFNVYKTLAAAAWTGSGTKGVRGNFSYEAA